MFHKVVTLIIGITLCWIPHEITARDCPESEALTFLSARNQPSCDNKEESGIWEFGKRCICAPEWFVRNKAGECIPAWTCPDVCPPNEEFERCTGKDQRLIGSDDFTAKEVLDLCKPVCSCKAGHARSIEQGQCVWAPFRNKFIGNRG